MSIKGRFLGRRVILIKTYVGKQSTALICLVNAITEAFHNPE